MTNLGSRAVAENAELFGRLPAGEGMSGVFDHASSRFVLRHSTTASPLPEGSVARYGGHRAVRGDLAEALGDDLSSAASGRLSGFSVSKQADGSVRFGWNSGQINPGSHGTRAVPAELQAEIEASVRAALGL